MQKRYQFIAMFSLVMICSTANAVPILQVGAPAGPGDLGDYADYQTNLTNPTEEDTAVTSGNKLLIAGITEGLVSLGAINSNWDDSSEVKFGSADFTKFNGHGTVLIATASTAGSGLTVDGANPFLTDQNLSFLNNHAPLQEEDVWFMYYDIGEFLGGTAIPNFDEEGEIDPESGQKKGEIKELALEIAPDFDGWIHFDVLSIAVDSKYRKGEVVSTFTIENNPGSHDVTWKDGDPPPIPEPTTMLLFGAGLVGLAGYLRRKKNVLNVTTHRVYTDF